MAADRMDSFDEASDAVLLWCERPADKSDVQKQRAGWGRLKSGIGWSALEYAKRI